MVLTLASQHPGVRIQQAGSMQEAADWVGRLRELDLMVVDLDLVGSGSLDAISRAAESGVSVVVLASSGRPQDVVTCIRAGARGYVAKSGSSSVLEQSIALALSDDCYIPVPRSALERRSSLRPPEEGMAGVVDRLTGRQQDISRLLLAGCSNKEIARSLGVLEGTVKVHVRAVMQKLRVRNRTQVAVAAARLGLPAGAG
jgi:DNA-binding NarL/FixJ family response regulator